ncbi:MAG TPA: hypothetical protein VKB51_03920 [bacterium]|nr:hypothetical protein [bacterium]
MKIPFYWEVMDAQTLRAKVLGGWLVRFHGSSGDVSLTIVPDPKHEWEVVVPPEVVQASRERLAKLEEKRRDPYLDDGIGAEMDDEMSNLRRFIGLHE